MESSKCYRSAPTPPGKGKAGEMGCDPQMFGLGLHEENHLELSELLRGMRRRLELPQLAGHSLCSTREQQLLLWFTWASTPRSMRLTCPGDSSWVSGVMEPNQGPALNFMRKPNAPMGMAPSNVALRAGFRPSPIYLNIWGGAVAQEKGEAWRTGPLSGRVTTWYCFPLSLPFNFVFSFSPEPPP